MTSSVCGCMCSQWPGEGVRTPGVGVELLTRVAVSCPPWGLGTDL